MLNLNGSVPQFRVDHITVNAVPAGGNPYFALLGYQSFQLSTPPLYGLFDHITYNCTQDGTCDAFLFYGRDWLWTQPTTMGSLQAVYIEDSSFNCSACTGQHFNTVTDGQHGANSSRATTPSEK